ncbi:hypothetical protein K450DRAFT_263238 [Umbelopsis ramanniana AG]|uniref:Beta-lactamase-related domain-containing protein n=1 Tax=Umbelopsis ramanniana AG TaxID=1314678 RepID=A0AAD5H7L1_UMBRA|nr:uncharacterized protein K450DRAFT_263238 [Umbelopsis ramanniana AG]KAI8575117.1 hypothetical protein K450DRAFT_263238 [Umbelopsis ramanniana AG]
MADSIESSFQAAIDAGKINGAVICATDAEGRFVYEKAMGERTLLSGEKRPQKLNDVLFLASATKLITTIAVLQCIEDGLLTLTGDLSSIVPELTSKQVITGFSDDNETPLLEQVVRSITLEMLLTHSSGVTYFFLNPHVVRWREKFAAPLQEDDRRSVEELFSYPLAFQPGDGWMYGTGLDWAGLVVERVTGRTLSQFMQQRIFDPLGISDAEFYPVTRDDLRARLVDLNPKDPEALGRAVFGGGGDDMNKPTRGNFGGHGLFLPGADYIKILHSLLAGDSKLLKPTTVDTMFQHHLSPKATEAHKAAMTSPMGAHFRVGIDPEMKAGHGLGGLLMLQDVDDWYGEHTLTWGGGMSLVWFIDRKNNLCGVGAVQIALPADHDTVDELKKTFSRDVYRKYAVWKENHVAL